MPLYNESQLTRRILTLRESSTDAEALSSDLRAELHCSAEEADTLAAALEDRFLSSDEQLDLLGTLDLRSCLAAGATVSGFLSRLSGPDGREALRYQARCRVEGLAADPRDGATAPLDADALRELAALLPSARGIAGSGIPLPAGLSAGIYRYLQPEDPFLGALVSELRRHRETASDPILRMRSARVLAELGDRDAEEFLRQSAASFAIGYSGGLPLDERVARACGLAVDGDVAAIRFLQNLAMDPRAATERRVRALSYLPPESLDDGSDAVEVFACLAEDPEEPPATRFLLLRLLARAPHPPELSWWRERLRDPSMTVLDRNPSRSAGPAGETRAEYSSWNLVLSAWGESRAPWSGELLVEAMGNRGLPTALRREALMAYILHEGHGTVPWSSFRDVLAAPPGAWGSLLADVENGTELRLRFPARVAGAGDSEFDLRALSCVGKEIVLQIREGTMGRLRVDFRPLDPARDVPSARPVLPETESALPINRRIFLDGVDLVSPEVDSDVAVAAWDEVEAEVLASENSSPVRLASNEQRSPWAHHGSNVQRDRNASAAEAGDEVAAETALGI